MSIGSADTVQSFPFAHDKVFRDLLIVLPVAGFKVKSHDKLIGRVLVSAPMSGFSWGEDITIRLTKQGESQTDVAVQSNLKMGTNLMATGKNAQNAERIIGALSHFLQHGGDPKDSVKAAPSNATSPVVAVVMLVIFLLIFLPVLLTNF